MEANLEVRSGEEKNVPCRIKSRPPQQGDQEHHICRKGSNDRVDKFRVDKTEDRDQLQIIILDNMIPDDSGDYIIHPEGLDKSGEFRLKVLESRTVDLNILALSM